MNQVKSLKQLSYGGLAAAVLLIIVPQEAFAMHIMEGFLPPMWALAWWLLFLPCLWYGLVRLAAYRSGREQSEGAAGPLRGVYFCSFGAEDPVGDR